MVGSLLDTAAIAQGHSERYSAGESNSSSSSSSSSNGSSPIPFVPRSPISPWEELALPLFFNLFTAGDAYKYQGFMPHLPAVYNRSSSTSCLHLAVSAAVEANAVRKLTGDDAMTQARRKYSLALGAVQRALEDPADAVEDATLFSLMILTLFEVRQLH